MFFMVRTPRKTVGPVSDKIGGHKRMTTEAGIATIGVRFGCFILIIKNIVNYLSSFGKSRTLDEPVGSLVIVGCDIDSFRLPYSPRRQFSARMSAAGLGSAA